jgi:signal transduction histidine kinase
VFGAIFPVVGWVVAMSNAAEEGLRAAHTMQPVLYIVDLAPLVLGLTGYAIGHYHARLIKARLSIEQVVATRTTELRSALADLAETQADKDRFVASVSHELRTPLAAVVGFAHALAEQSDQIDAQERAEVLHLIIRESEEVAAIVEDLLVATRLDRDELAMAEDLLRLDEEVCAVVEVCDVAVSPLRIEALQVLGDSVRIHQIARNLITNADRYGGDAITVEVYADADEAILEVKDNGSGIPADKAELVFAAFGKAHSDPGRTESVGLGLTVSRNLARMMGGDVTYSRCDGWTCFSLRLPLVAVVTGDDPQLVSRRMAQPHRGLIHHAGRG